MVLTCWLDVAAVYCHVDYKMVITTELAFANDIENDRAHDVAEILDVSKTLFSPSLSVLYTYTIQ